MEPKALKSRNKPQLLAIILLTTVIVLSFANTLTNSFHCDDFFHTDFLYHAFSDKPGRLASIWYTPWLNDTSFICFYRPLTEVSLAIDYWLYQAYGAGYHATNIMLHLLNCFIACQLFKRLIKLFIDLDQGTVNFYALAATLIFACLPTHSEAVAWVLSRSDLVSTLFYLLTLYSFSALIQTKKQIYSAASIVFMILALLSKESAISLPFVMLTLAFFCGALKRTVAPLVLQFGISGLYLLWRATVLGTLMGGYSGSLGELMAGGLMDRWFSSEVLFQIFHPFNEHLISPTSPLRLIFRLLYIVFAILIMLAVRFDQVLKAKVRLIGFLLLWAVLALLPSAQIIGVTNLMSGGRVEYLPAVAAALTLTLAISTLRPTQSKGALTARFVSMAAISTFIVTSMITVQKNNMSWQLAGSMINSLNSQIKQQLESMPGDQRLVIFNLPSQMHGAFTFTNDLTFRGLVSRPLLDDDGNRVVSLDFRPLISPTLNLSDIKTALAHPDRFKLMYFDQRELTLKPYIRGTSGSVDLAFVDKRDVDSSLGMVQEYYYTCALSPLDGEVLQVKTKISSTKPDQEVKIFIDFNDRPKDYDDYSSWFKVKADGQMHQIDFPMAAHKSWLLVKEIKTIKLTVVAPPAQAQLEPPQLTIKSSRMVTPDLLTDQPGIIRSKWQGGWHLPPLHFDAGGVPAASGIAIELSRPDFYFEHYCGAGGDGVPARVLAAREQLAEIKGDLANNKIILQQMAKADGIYQLRIAAIDNHGKIIGGYCQPVTIDCRTTTKNPAY